MLIQPPCTESFQLLHWWCSWWGWCLDCIIPCLFVSRCSHLVFQPDLTWKRALAWDKLCSEEGGLRKEKRTNRTKSQIPRLWWCQQKWLHGQVTANFAAWYYFYAINGVSSALRTCCIVPEMKGCLFSDIFLVLQWKWKKCWLCFRGQGPEFIGQLCMGRR